MPAKSKEQKNFMQLALAVKTGAKDKSEVSKDVVDAAESMSKSELKKYAKGDIEEKLRKVVREEVENVLDEDHLSKNQLDQLDQVMMDFRNSYDSLHNATENINMFYGDNGKHNESIKKFTGDLLGEFGEIIKRFKAVQRLLYDEYPDYNWSFPEPKDTSHV